MLSYVADIINNHFDDIAQIAATVGIDWSQHADSYKIPEVNKKVAAINKAHKGKCGYIIRVDTNKHGIEFPSIVFSSFVGGGQSATWTGIKALVNRNQHTTQTPIATAPQANPQEEGRGELAKLHGDRAESLANYVTMTPCAKHQYLDKKGLDGYAELFAVGTHKNYNNVLAYPITDIASGDLVGYGWVHSSGARGRSAGSGQCVAVVDYNQDSDAKTVYVTEGMSDALTIAAATNCRAVAALGANSIHNVVNHLATTKRYNNIIIAADNDDAGLKCCKSNTNYAYSVVRPLMRKDYNDVYVKDGLSALLAQLDNVVYVRSLPQHNRYCNFNIIPRAVNVMTAEKGTGKTVAIKNYISNADVSSVLIISHRRSLSTKLANDFNCENYEDISLALGKQAFAHAPRLVISVEQLTHLDMRNAAYDVVIIDECEQVIDHSTTSGTVPNCKLSTQYLAALCNKARTVILSDANILAGTERLISKLASRGRVVNRLINTYKPRKARGDTITLLSTQAAVNNEYSRKLGSGERVVYISDSKADTDKAYNIACKIVDESRVLLLNSATMDKHAALLADINNKIDAYTTVIYSPALGTGFSIDEGHGFASACGIFRGQSTTAETASQMLARFRGLGDYTLFVGNTSNALPTTYKAAERLYIYEPISLTDKATQLETLTIDLDGQPVIDIYSELRLSVGCVKAVSANDFKKAFVNVMREEGFAVSESDSDSEEDKLHVVEEAEKEVAERAEQEKTKSLSALKDEIKRHVDSDNVATLIAETHASGALRRIVKAGVLAKVTRKQARLIDSAQTVSYHRGDIAAIDLNHTYQRAELYKTVCQLTGLGTTDNIDLSTVDVSKIARKVKSLYRVTLNSKDSAKAAGQLLRLYGIKTKATKTRIGKDIVRTYHIDGDSVDTANVIMTHLSKDILIAAGLNISDAELDVLGLNAL